MSYRAKKILTAILFLFFGTMVFSKSIRSFFADDTMKLITQHKNKIDTVGAKHKSYVTRKIDEARKMFDELDDGMSQHKYSTNIIVKLEKINIFGRQKD
jgi:23S rRNA maturation mini-RNase III